MNAPGLSQGWGTTDWQNGMLTRNEGATLTDPNDPVASAKKQTAEAQQREEQITQAAELDQAIQKADQARVEARARSESAFKLKPNTPAGKKAHQTAAIAHTDAATQYKAMGGMKSGNGLDKRAKALRMAKEHQATSEKHTQLAEGDLMTKATLNTGYKNVLVTMGGPGSGPKPGEVQGPYKSNPGDSKEYREMVDKMNKTSLSSNYKSAKVSAEKASNRASETDKVSDHIDARNKHIRATKLAAATGDKEGQKYHRIQAADHEEYSNKGY